MNESEFQTSVRRLAHQLGFRTFHATDMKRSDAGFPDLVIAGHGHVLLVELKTKAGKLTAAQRAWLDDAGAYGKLWRPDDMQTIIQTLTALRTAGRTRQRRTFE